MRRHLEDLHKTSQISQRYWVCEVETDSQMQWEKSHLERWIRIFYKKVTILFSKDTNNMNYHNWLTARQENEGE